MIVFHRLVIVFATVLLFASCSEGDSGSSSGGSGIGGTGITLVKGNVSDVNGQTFVYFMPEKASNVVDYIAQWLIPLSFAQNANFSSLTVSGGGQTSAVNAAGEFVLPGVAPSSNFVLTFTIDGTQDIPLNIGQVLGGAVVTVSNIAINTNAGSAQPGDIDVHEPEYSEADDDRDDVSEDDVSEDDVSEDDVSEDDVSEDDVSEDDV